MTSLRSFGRRPEPHYLILARGEDVRAVAVTPWLIGLCSAVGFALAAWLVGTTTYVLLEDEIVEAARFYNVEKERLYEDRIASLRRQIDEINSRQFLDQQTIERRLSELRHRQASIEARQVQITGLFGEAEERDLSVDAAALEPQVPAGGQSYYTASIGARPFPARTGGDMLPAADPAVSDLQEIESSMERFAATQELMLAALEKSVHHRIESLAAIPEAIGLPAPEAAEAVGGPYVALRGGEQEVDDDNRMARISRAMGRIDALKEHVSHLPVRRPIEGTSTSSGYGKRMDPFLRRPAMHTGIDFRARSGTPVRATAAGKVVKAGRLGGYGNLVEIDHGNGYQTRYAHLSAIHVERGQTVARGEVVGKVGSTGRSTGPHLHYETRISGNPRNPTPYLEAAKLLPAGY